MRSISSSHLVKVANVRNTGSFLYSIASNQIPLNRFIKHGRRVYQMRAFCRSLERSRYVTRRIGIKNLFLLSSRFCRDLLVLGRKKKAQEFIFTPGPGRRYTAVQANYRRLQIAAAEPAPDKLVQRLFSAFCPRVSDVFLEAFFELQHNKFKMVHNEEVNLRVRRKRPERGRSVYGAKRVAARMLARRTSLLRWYKKKYSRRVVLTAAGWFPRRYRQQFFCKAREYVARGVDTKGGSNQYYFH